MNSSNNSISNKEFTPRFSFLFVGYLSSWTEVIQHAYPHTDLSVDSYLQNDQLKCLTDTLLYSSPLFLYMPAEIFVYHHHFRPTIRTVPEWLCWKTNEIGNQWQRVEVMHFRLLLSVPRCPWCCFFSSTSNLNAQLATVEQRNNFSSLNHYVQGNGFQTSNIHDMFLCWLSRQPLQEGRKRKLASHYKLVKFSWFSRQTIFFPVSICSQATF